MSQTLPSIQFLTMAYTLLPSSMKAAGGGSTAGVQGFLQAVEAALERSMQIICYDMEQGDTSGAQEGALQHDRGARNLSVPQPPACAAREGPENIARWCAQAVLCGAE